MRKTSLFYLIFSGLLAACSSGTVQDFNPGALVSGGRDLEAERQALGKYAVVQICPEVQVRDGTQMLRRYSRGKEGEASALLFQASIQKFARECKNDGRGGTVLKVGTAGRVIAGPAGGARAVDLPLRVVLLRNGSEVLYSELHKTSVALGPDQPSVPWTSVIDNITVPRQEGQARFVIYVGFDEGAGR